MTSAINAAAHLQQCRHLRAVGPGDIQLLVVADAGRSPTTKKGRCGLHGGARGSGAPSGERNGQYRHGERTKAAIAERQKFSALLKMLRAGVT